MMITVSSPRALDFACRSAACAPPPAGKGGSRPSNRTNLNRLTVTGIRPRDKMPQFSGVPVPGSPAAKLPRTARGTVNATDAFLSHLKDRGVPVRNKTMKASRLKASQTELVESKVREIASQGKEKRIFVSKDGYVIDGHHHWAAARAHGGKSSSVKVREVGLNIREALDLATRWSKAYGIKPKSA